MDTTLFWDGWEPVVHSAVMVICGFVVLVLILRVSGPRTMAKMTPLDFIVAVTIGAACTIGHRATLHGCSIGDGTLVGMSATILNGARIGRNCLIGAGTLIAGGKEIPDNCLVTGAPGKVVRELDEEESAHLAASALNYVANARRFAAGLSRL